MYLSSLHSVHALRAQSARELTIRRSRLKIIGLIRFAKRIVERFSFPAYLTDNRLQQHAYIDRY